MLYFTETQNHRMFGVGRDLCGSSSPTLLPKHLSLYPNPEVVPSMPQCVVGVVWPLAKDKLIVAILAVPGKVKILSITLLLLGGKGSLNSHRNPCNYLKHIS